jgi:hypothetical protein
MSRTIDQCTCGHERRVHSYPSQDWFNGKSDVYPKNGGDGECASCECKHFFPHPQPATAESIPFGRKLQVFLESCGEVKYRGTIAFVTELDGKVWEVSNNLRKDPAASP